MKKSSKIFPHLTLTGIIVILAVGLDRRPAVC